MRSEQMSKSLLNAYQVTKILWINVNMTATVWPDS